MQSPQSDLKVWKAHCGPSCRTCHRQVPPYWAIQPQVEVLSTCEEVVSWVSGVGSWDVGFHGNELQSQHKLGLHRFLEADSIFRVEGTSSVNGAAVKHAFAVMVMSCALTLL